MSILREGALELTLPSGVQGRKFDDPSHGLSHCMNAVDFILEEPKRTLFIEFKDPDHPDARSGNKETFIKSLLSGGKDDELVRKFRDSFIYYWAEDKVKKPIIYLVLIATSKLDEAMLLARMEELKRKLPVEGPPSGVWRRQIATNCCVFNIKTWNKHLPRYRVRRV